MIKDGKKRLVSILIVMTLMFSMVVLLTQPVLAAVDLNVSKTSNLTYGETIWVNVSGLTPDEDYGIWIEKAVSGWEENVSEDTADSYGRISVEVDIPYRNPLGDYTLSVRDMAGTDIDSTTIQIYNTYLVKMKVNGNEVSSLLHNRTYEYGGDLELTFEIYNGSNLIDDWNLETILFDPEGVYIDSKTIGNGKWIPNIVTFDYVGDLPNREVNYWLWVIPNSGHTGEWTNISIPVKLNVTATISPSDIEYGDEDVTVTVYVKDWDWDEEDDLNVAGYTVSVYSPATDGNYILVGQDTTGSNGRAILNFDTTDGSAGTWYIGTQETGTYRIDESEKLDIQYFIAYASFNVESDDQPPEVEITSPKEGDTIVETIAIAGTAYDSDGEITKVEIRIGTNDWLVAIGTTFWIYILDTTNIPHGDLLIEARSYDGELYSSVDSINVNVPPFFIHITDIHAVSNQPQGDWKKMVDHIKQLDVLPLFVICSGDLVDFGSDWNKKNPTGTYNYMEFLKPLGYIGDNLNIVSTSGVYIPLYCCPGNHDYYDEFFKSRSLKNYRDNIHKKEYYTITDYTDVAIFSMKSGRDIFNYPVYYPDLIPPEGDGLDDDQISWLDLQLDLLDNTRDYQDTSGRYKIIFMHHPYVNGYRMFYGSSSDVLDGVFWENRSDFWLLCQQYNVDLVLCGHEHNGADVYNGIWNYYGEEWHETDGKPKFVITNSVKDNHIYRRIYITDDGLEIGGNIKAFN